MLNKSWLNDRLNTTFPSLAADKACNIWDTAGWFWAMWEFVFPLKDAEDEIVWTDPFSRELFSLTDSLKSHCAAFYVVAWNLLT